MSLQPRSQMLSFLSMRFEVQKQEVRSRLQTICESMRTGSKIMEVVSVVVNVVVNAVVNAVVDYCRME
jgi:hypothetical protein